ncbi:MAG: SIS domain-containing protein [Rhodobacteraceae bacterium]|jgi:fructoselysine 6-phosphate deglycase|nr:SIS domain-containing protein [Paracoccaceae bacterium]
MRDALDPDILGALAALAGREIAQVYLVACGGSLSIMHPGKFVLDRHAPMLPADALNASEFVQRAPARLGPGALVILCSQTGTTRETVAAAEFARSRGAATVALTMEPGSPLGRAAGHVLRYAAPYTTGIPIDPADSNYSVLYMLLAGLIRQRGGADLTAPLLASLSALGPVIEGARSRLADRLDAYALRVKDRPVVYTMASGVNFGAAYSFAICVLMEMQWIASQAIHAGEFFHGPFEVVDRDACFILLVGLDPTRPSEERARAFLQRFGDPANILDLDAATFDLAGLADPWRAYLLPLVFFDVLWDFAHRLARLRGHPMLTGRRYMKKITDY